MNNDCSRRFPKSERLCSRRLIDKLFNGGGSFSMAAFPLRIVYTRLSAEEQPSAAPSLQMLVSVPKRYFKRAVKRNRVKRQVREAYRAYRHLVTDNIANDNHYIMAFIWLDSELHSTENVQQCVKKLMQRMSEKL